MSSAKSYLRSDAGPLTAAGAAFVLLVAVSGRYGYHRDELYFLAAGHHLAWGYPDQPPFVPALARAMSAIAPGSLPVLRLPSAIASAIDVLLTARLAREFGASRGGQTVAAVAMATAPFVLGSGHLTSTATFDLLAWTALLYLVVRIIRTGNDRLFVVAGVVAGAGLMDNDLVAFLLVGLGIGVLIDGPRSLFRSPWLWVGVVVAIAMWAPYLAWQGQNGWPELTVSRNIAAGGSGSSTPRWALVPMQIVLCNPWLAPVWIAGLWRLLRSESLRWARAVGWCWLFLVVAFTAGGGKAYYLTGMVAALFAAGADPALDWVRRKPGPARAVAVGAVISTIIGAVVTLPLIPLGQVRASGIVNANYDTGETIAWPTYVEEITAVFHGQPPGAVILASNYGEAGAVERYAHLTAYSGHNGFWWWGPPPHGTPRVVTVGFARESLSPYFAHCTLGTRLDNHLGIDNDEQGAHVFVCDGMRGNWAAIWPQLKSIG
jgi:4-amino-4-deoxy-L-arabinose transferase-like glycosyltransferase